MVLDRNGVVLANNAAAEPALATLAHHSDATVILMTAHPTVQTAISVLRKGAELSRVVTYSPGVPDASAEVRFQANGSVEIHMNDGSGTIVTRNSCMISSSAA